MPWMNADYLENTVMGRHRTETLESLSDEFERLDLLIRRRILSMQARGNSRPLDPFKSMVISDDEINGLLQEPLGLWKNPVPDDSSEKGTDRFSQAYRTVETRIAERRASSPRNHIPIPLFRLARIFSLSPFEEQCLILCLAPEIDRKYERLYGYLHDDLTRKQPSVGLVLDLLCDDVQQKLEARKVFDPRSPLLKYRLLHCPSDRRDDGSSFLSRSLCIDKRIADFLLGFAEIDSRLEALARLSVPDPGEHSSDWFRDVPVRPRTSLHPLLSGDNDRKKNAILHIHGPYGAGKKTLAMFLCADLGRPLLLADLREFAPESPSFDESAFLLCREAALQPAVLCLEHVELLYSDDSRRQHLDFLVRALRLFQLPLTVLLGNAPWKPQGLWGEDRFFSMALPVPDDGTRKRLWEEVGREGELVDEGVDFSMLSGQFRFTPGQIRDAMAAAANLAHFRSPRTGAITLEDLYAACREQCNPKLSRLARKIEPKYRWQDLVLSGEGRAHLQELCAQARYRHIVYGEWGFDKKLSYGKGLTALFSGPPGTGKTMAAEVIANELRLDLYKIDLSRIVSKYIGETEKNLDRIFSEAQTSNAILFFDEADALFGKRSEVKDAHDRYANIEISYLLQKMEEYEGIAILATNLRANLDEAFLRRIGTVIEFPFPDEEERRLIWEKIWPETAPTGDRIHLEHMAKHFEISGGNIRNIALAAAFMAADNGGRIEMSHLLRATRREYQKMGKIVMDGPFEFPQDRS